MKRSAGNIKSRQKNRQEKRKYFQPTRKSCKKRTSCIIIERLKIFNKQMRYNQYIRRTVNNNGNSSFADFSAHSIRSFRYSYSVK